MVPGSRVKKATFPVKSFLVVLEDLEGTANRAVLTMAAGKIDISNEEVVAGSPMWPSNIKKAGLIYSGRFRLRFRGSSKYVRAPISANDCWSSLIK